MARRPAPVSYSAALIVEQPGARPAAPAPIAQVSSTTIDTSVDAVPPSMPMVPVVVARTPTLDEMAGEGRVRRPLEDKSDPSVLYLHPSGKKALRLYAVEKGCKVHDLLLEAVEEWANARGLAGPWRVPSAGPARRKRG